MKTLMEKKVQKYVDLGVLVPIHDYVKYVSLAFCVKTAQQG